MWLTLAAMRNAIAVLMASLAIVLLGATSLNRMPIDLFPNINFPQIQIGTVYKGASAQDIERSVTYPLEKAVSAVANVKHVESRSRQGFSLVIVQFVWGTDIDAALTELVQRINQIINTLPPGVQQPFIVKSDLSNIPVCVVTVSGGGLDERALYDLAYNTIEPQFERLPGVASANVDGGKIRQITINLDRDRLYSKGLSVNEVTRAVNDANFLLPSGDVKVGADVRVTADPYKGEVFAGSIARVVHNLDPRSRTMGVEVAIPNPGTKLNPGMFARVEAVVDTRTGVLTVPMEALRVGDGRPSVMVVRNNVVEPVAVELGAADARGVEIVKGLAAGDQVILQGKDLVRKGQTDRGVPATGQ